MTSRKQKRIVRMQRRPRVLLALPGCEERQVHAIVEAAHDWEWDLLDITMSRGYIPPEPTPLGAIVDCSPAAPLVKRLRRMGIPVVRLGGGGHPRDHELPAVLPDHAAAGRLAAAHFVERGFKHVAYEASIPWPDARPLYEGFKAGAREQGLTIELLRMSTEPPPLPVTRETAAEHKRRFSAIADWLRHLSKPVGVLSQSASTLCSICHQVGLDVPEEVALLGVGNHLLPCELSPVPLSSIDMAAEEQARRAAQLLRRLINGEAAPTEPIVIPPHGVVTRRSTDVLAVADATVAQAMRFMWENLDADLSVDDVAAQVGTSSRSLQRAFRRHLGRGVIAEMRRRRLQALARLLRTSDLPITDLAPTVGFRTLVHLHKCFRDTYGMTPREYRRKHRAA
ncbi:MAG: substrate-binding domain-containing protein [Verrucomicrobia bacterium]|nr:substrate-binding domain-containing protein [Verrucomicrobiota bacterium]